MKRLNKVILKIKNTKLQEDWQRNKKIVLMTVLLELERNRLTGIRPCLECRPLCDVHLFRFLLHRHPVHGHRSVRLPRHQLLCQSV